ncbi:MAG: hypothetical protein U0S50_13765 [Sphingopyxis sp.]|uniref:hypothetical protein n=1 Tax=Sphingopyxis sp. TaxID=1908224 RepID=UPI002ABB8325|nr:hypothetical protein [Sphingopyxis sp.]MDZ3832863.1 hypothetical protein [Sphingopyxis sp.]
MHRFRIDAIVDAQSLPRIAGFFAQRAIVPDDMSMRIADGRMLIDVAVAGLCPARAAVIAAKLGELYAVLDAGCERREPVA